MSKATRATRALDAAGVAYRLHPYDYAAEAGAKGLQAAQALGLPPERVLKSLMAWVDQRAVCVVVPSDRRVQLKKLAAAGAGKAARMMEVADAERLTGYKVGGISPFGQRRQVPTVLDEAALGHAAIYLNGGRRGLQVHMAPGDVVKVTGAGVAAIAT